MLVFFNKRHVHLYDTVLCWFLVSSLGPLILVNDPLNERCCQALCSPLMKAAAALRQMTSDQITGLLDHSLTSPFVARERCSRPS